MLSQIRDRAEFVAYLNNTYSIHSKRPNLKALIYNTTIYPEELIEIVDKKYSLKKSFFINVNLIDKNLYLINLSRLFNQKYLKGNILIDSSEENIWIVICEEKDNYTKFVVERFFDLLYPNISNIYLNTQQIKTILNDIKNYRDIDLRINYFACKLEPKPETLYFEGFKKGTVQHWKIDVENELNKLSESYIITVTNINFKLFDKDKILLLEGSISRNGKCQLKSGSFKDFYNYIIKETIKTGFLLKSFFSNRERYEINGNIELKPFQIYYKNFFNTSQLKLLGKKITNQYLCSIIHNGNPYFAANISDIEDGSSFGITVLKNKVTITPIVKSSFESTWKLADHLQAILGDGEISNIDY